MCKEAYDDAQEGRHELVISRNCGRYDILIPALATGKFQFLHRSAPWTSTVREILGPDCVLVFAGCVWSDPGSAEGAWHADGRHLFPGSADHDPCHCLNVFVPLVDIDDECGPTVFLPGSHVRRDRGAEIGAGEDIYTPHPKAGDALLFDFRYGDIFSCCSFGLNNDFFVL